MPRGVYDRSLTKEQRAALKTKDGKAAPKRKYTKKAAATAAPKRKYTRRAAVSAPAKASFSQDGAFVMMGEIRSNLATLAQVRNTFGDIPSITTETEAQVAVLSQLRDKIFSEQSTEETVSEEEVIEDEAVQTPNGVSTQSVPLPPPPPVVPVLPTPA